MVHCSTLLLATKAVAQRLKVPDARVAVSTLHLPRYHVGVTIATK